MTLGCVVVSAALPVGEPTLETTSAKSWSLVPPPGTPSPATFVARTRTASELS